MNFRGKTTNRHIVAFESDDWGSVRMQSPEAFNFFKSKGYAVEECAYNRFDQLENNDDVSALIETLTAFKDRLGKPVNFTLNNVIGNPDFKKIRESQFAEYFLEPFTNTYLRYPNHNHVLDLFNNGRSQGCFTMQFHGREHVNVDNWMAHLRNGDETVLQAFEFEMFSVHRWKYMTRPRQEFLDTYGLGYDNSIVEHGPAVCGGLDMFKTIWNEPSKTLIAPTCVWGDDVEIAALSKDVFALQGVFVQLVPDRRHQNGYHIQRLYQGRKTKNGLFNLMRNVFFEPSSNSKIDWVNNCLREIEVAFLMKKPAIIATHRVNYMGGMQEANRKQNLNMLKDLIRNILKRYPEVEFMSSDRLAVELFTD